MKYLVRDQQGRDLACLLFGAPAWQAGARDQFLGWDQNQRAAGLPYLTNNTRYLILPWVKVSGLAAFLLSQVCTRLSQDWQVKYGHPIYLLETFVEQGRFTGACYRAANWLCVGQTKGRGRQGPNPSAPTQTIKDVFLYPLIGRWIQWTKPAKASPWLTLAQWLGLPQQLTLRSVKGSLYRKGYRVRQVTTVTTLLDPQLYPAEEILQAYLRRWRLEMCLDDIKTSLQLEMLRSHSPVMCQKEVYTRLIAHNLIRCTMAQAALEHEAPLDQISFKGCVDAVRQFAQARAQARSKKKRQELWAELLKILATDLLPDRPGRREPRAVKRKKNKYPRLNAPRHKFRDHPKRHDRRKISRLRKLGVM